MDKIKLDSKKADLLQKQNGNFGLWSNLGDDYLNIDDIKSAIECYKKAIEYDSDIVEIYLNIGVAYNKIGDEKKAIAYFQKSVDIKPEYGNGWYNLGYAYCSIHNINKCLDCYSKSIQCLMPPKNGAFCTMGYEFLKQNDLNKAYKSLILGLINLAPQKENELRAMILLNLGHVYFLSGDVESAREKYYNSMCYYDKKYSFIEDVEADIPDLIHIGLDENKWRDMINSIKNVKKIDVKTFVNKVFSFIKNSISEINVYIEDTQERLIFYIDKDKPLIGWRFKDAYKSYLNGSVEWEFIAFGLTKQINKLLNVGGDLTLLPVLTLESVAKNTKTKLLDILPEKDNRFYDDISDKKWWKFWE